MECSFSESKQAYISALKNLHTHVINMENKVTNLHTKQAKGFNFSLMYLPMHRQVILYNMIVGNWHLDEEFQFYACFSEGVHN